MKPRLIKISEIFENTGQIEGVPTNPREISKKGFEKLKKSIQDFPEMLDLRPIVVDENNIVLGGNMRLKALKELKYKEVPVIYAKGLTAEQKKEFLIKDNAAFGEWDMNLLANEWDTELLNNWGLELPSPEKEEPKSKSAVKYSIICDTLEQLDDLRALFVTAKPKINYDEFMSYLKNK